MESPSNPKFKQVLGFYLGKITTEGTTANFYLPRSCSAKCPHVERRSMESLGHSEPGVSLYTLTKIIRSRHLRRRRLIASRQAVSRLCRTVPQQALVPPENRSSRTTRIYYV